MSYNAWDRTFLFSKFGEPAFDLKFHYIDGLYVYQIYDDNYDTAEDRRAFLARSNLSRGYDGTGQFQSDDDNINSAGDDINSAANIFSAAATLDTTAAPAVSAAVSAAPVWTKAERLLAAAARKFHELTGHMGRNEMELAIRRGNFSNNKVLSNHLRLADGIFGPCPVCVKAKAKRPSLLDRTREHTELVGHTQHVDLFYLNIKGKLHVYFIFVDEASNNVLTHRPKSGTRTNFGEAVKIINGFYLHHRHSPVRVIYSDNEGAVHQFEPEFMATGGKIFFKAAGEHIGLAERYIGVLKEIIRTIVTGLQYVFPTMALSYLVDEAKLLLSMRSNPKTSGVPVGELVQHMKPDYARMTVCFGAYGLAANPRPRNDVQFPNNADFGLVVSRTVSGERRFTVLLLHNRQFVSRKDFVPMPLSIEIIAVINRLSGPCLQTMSITTLGVPEMSIRLWLLIQRRITMTCLNLSMMI